MEAYYQYAARTAGTTVQASLDATLRNSATMKAIANNATARAKFKEQYNSSVQSYVKNNSYWNEGLNYFSYLTGGRAYLYRPNVVCTDVSGGWAGINTANGNGGYVNATYSGITGLHVYTPGGGKPGAVRTNSAKN